MDVPQEIQKVIDAATRGLGAVARRIDSSAVEAVDRLFECKGKIVVIGMGKCYHVAGKIASTLASTGTPAAVLHPAEAIHGDLGFVAANDVALLLSNSGETPEILALLPNLKRLGIPIVSLTGETAARKALQSVVNNSSDAKLESSLVTASDAVIDTSVDEEGCPLDLAPMASTTVMLAVGDALAAVLMKKRAFSVEDYAVLHPGGVLGRRLLCVVDELMERGAELPVSRLHDTVEQAVLEMTSKRLGTTFVLDDEDRLVGILTDGDLRRLFQKSERPFAMKVSEAMTKSPKTTTKDTLAVDALRHMEDSRAVTILGVVDEEQHLIGAVHIHDLIRTGIA